jgi:hypothetical protein
MITIVGVTGRLVSPTGQTVSTSRTGKGTFVKSLELFHDFTRIGFADAMGSVLNNIGGPSGEVYKHLNGDGWFRSTKMKFGTEARKRANAGPVWRHLVATTISYFAVDYPQPILRWAIEDMRYDLEGATMTALARNLGGRFVLVDVSRTTTAEPNPDRHSSERGMRMRPHAQIWNSGTKRSLIMQSEEIGKQILSGDFDHDTLSAFEIDRMLREGLESAGETSYSGMSDYR